MVQVFRTILKNIFLARNILFLVIDKINIIKQYMTTIITIPIKHPKQISSTKGTGCPSTKVNKSLISDIPPNITNEIPTKMPRLQSFETLKNPFVLQYLFLQNSLNHLFF